MSKNLSLNPKEFEEYLYDTREQRVMEHIGIQYIFRFPNSYGASVVKAYGTEGYEQDRWELCVILFEQEEKSYPPDWTIVYPSKIVEQGMTKGNLTEEEVYQNLKLIKEL